MLANLNARQGKAGQPLRISAAVSSSLSDDPIDASWVGLGVKTTSAAPSTFADFAYYEGGPVGDAYWNHLIEWYYTNAIGGVPFATNIRCSLGPKVIPLDSHFIAGRYLFLVASATDPPIGSTPVQLFSAPYHIL